jgi:steroid delta-isomerase-like uncharacterized protein
MPELAPAYRKILRRHLEAETAFDMEGTLATLTEDCLFEDVATGQTYRGRDAVREYYREWWDTFGITPVDIRSNVVSEESLIVETRFVGTHCTTGKPISLPVAIFITLRDGLMAGERFYYDRSTLLSQITCASP